MLAAWSCRSPLSVVRVHTYCCCDLVSGFTCYCPGMVRAYCQLSESARIVAVILSEVYDAIAMVMSVPTVSCKSLYLYSQ